MVAASLFVFGTAGAQQGAPAGEVGMRADVAIRMDERAIRAAGIVTTGVQREGGVADLMFPGQVVIPPQQIAIVDAPAAGLVESVMVAADEPVRAGQPLATLRAPALVEAQRQFLTSLSNEQLANDRLRRTRSLFEGRAIAERDLRVAETEAQIAATTREEQTQILMLLGMPEYEVEQLRRTRRIASTITLLAPRDGIVVTRHVAPGERVDVNAPVFTIARLSPLWVNLQVPAARLSVVPIGSIVLLPAQGAQGRINRIGRTVDPQTQSVVAVAEVDTNGGSVRPGLAVNVSVRVEQGGQAQWLVPTASVIRHRDRTWVFVRNAAGFLAKSVTVVAESQRGALIRGELSAEAQVAVRGVVALVAELAAQDQD